MPLALVTVLPQLRSTVSAAAATGATSTYESTVLADHPSVYYRLDETGGTTATDSSGNGITGQYSSTGVTYGVSGALVPSGDHDAAISVAANGTVTEPNNLGATPFSIEVWFQINSQSNGGTLFTDGMSGNAGPDYVALTESNNQPVLVSTNPGHFPNDYGLPSPWWDNQWHQLVYELSGSGETVYYDGQLIGTGSPINFGPSPVTFGGGFTGNLDEASIYPTTLSETQVNAHYNAGQSTVWPCASTPVSTYATTIRNDHPLAYYRFDDTNTGRIAHDVSGNCTATTPQAATYSTVGVSNQPAGALVPGGDHDAAISLAANGTVTEPTNLAPPFSIEVWFQINSQSNGGTLFTDGMSGNAGPDEVYLTESNNQPVLVSTNPGHFSNDYGLPSPWWDSQWHQLVYELSGSGEAVYYDGQLIGTAGPINWGPSAVTFGGGFTGNLDEASIYPRTLSQAQVNAHYNAGQSTVWPCASAPVSTYATTIRNDHPQAYYRFDDTNTGRIAHDVSGNCTATTPQAATYSTVGVSNQPAGALVPGGDHDAAISLAPGGSVTAPIDLAAPPFSIEVWFQINSQSNGGTLFIDGNTNAGPDTVYLTESNNQPVLVSNNPGHNPNQYGLPSPWWDSQWHQLVYELSGSGETVYYDGQLIGTGSPIYFNSIPTDVVTFGGFTGNLDEASIYPRTLSATQVASHFLAGHPGQGALIGGPVSPYSTFGGGSFCFSCLMKSIIHAVFGAPVDTEDGNMYHTFNDVQIPGRGYPLAFTRSYNSMAAATNGPLGYGWVDNLQANLAVPATVTTGSTVTFTEENGAQTVFTFDGSVWTAAPRVIATLTQNGDGSWTVVRDAQQTITFNASGQLTAMKDLNGYTTTFAYTGTELTTVTDQAGRQLLLGWTGSHITTVTDPNVSPHRVVRYAYDTAGNLKQVTDVNGGRTTFGYDSSHRMVSMKDPKCVATAGCPGIVTDYNSAGQVDYQTDQLGRKTTFVYSGDPSSATGGTTTVTDPKLNVTVETYEYGLRVAETRGYGTAQAATTVYRYDPATLQPTSVTDGDGNTTFMTYDSQGNLLSRQDPLGRTTSYTYNPLNEPLTVTDPKNVTTTSTYDPDGNLTSTSTPLTGTSATATNCLSPSTPVPAAQVTCYHYADSTHPGDVTSMADPDGKTWAYTYDTYGNRTSTKDPVADKTTSKYNADGWLLNTVSPKGNVTGCSCASQFRTTYSYLIAGTTKTDEFGDVQTVADPLGHATTYGYDADRNRIAVTDGDSHTTTFVYDLANQQTAIKRPDGTILVTDYNPDGTILDQKDGKGNAIVTYGYDSVARVTSVTDAVGDVTGYSYDPAGNRLATQRPGGNCAANPPVNCITYSYDGANELTGITYSDGVTPNVSNIGYDPDGQRTAMTDGTGTWAWTYDSLRRLTSATEASNGTVGFGYDLRGSLTKITYPGNLAVTRAYDGAGRWKSVTDWLSHTTRFGYDPNSNLTTETLPSATGIVDTTGYNNADQLTSITDAKGTSTLFAAGYSRDGNGQLTNDTSQPSAIGDYAYTSLNQLCYAGSSTTPPCSTPPSGALPYGYDAADNLVNMNGTTQSFNPADELCWTVTGPSTNSCTNPPSGATIYTYDPNGNRTAVTPTTASPTTLGYDQQDRLTSYTHGSTSATYAYNGDGLRMAKTVGTTTSHFLWDLSGSLPLMLADGTASYVYGPGGLPLERITGTTVLWYQHDQRGSTRLLTSASGAVQATYTYDPYGNIRSATGTATNPLRYTGQYQDTETGLYYLHARYYDPTTAQFLTVDPAAAKTMSPYGYVGGNPLNQSDPSGLCDWYAPVCQADVRHL